MFFPAFNFYSNGRYNNAINPFNNANLEPKQLYEKLWAFYNNNGLYEDIQTTAYYTSRWVEQIKPLRTVVNRSVEFYASKILANYKVTTDSDNLKSSVEQVLTWSNFKAKSKIAIRHDALLGNLFWKVNSDGKKVWFETIDPANVTSFTTDNRGYLTTIRLDVLLKDDKGDTIDHTEYYSKPENYYGIWESKDNTETTTLEQLKGLLDYGFLTELGVDFVPFVHVKFRDTGKDLGEGCVTHALDKVTEANREATRLTELLFRNNKPTWIVSANAEDKDKRPVAPPKLKQGTVGNDVTDDAVLYLPGMSTMQSLIPNINYAEALNILNAQMDELERDLPELRYYTIKDTGKVSGTAIRFALSAAIDRATEARENITSGLIRIVQMSLTVGSFWGLFSVGTFDNGDFDFGVTSDPILPTPEDERAANMKNYADAGVPLESALKFAGFNDDEIADAMSKKQAADAQKSQLDAQNLASAMNNFNMGH